MQNKTPNRWLDVQIVIITIVMTASLALWNTFATRQVNGGDAVAKTRQASSSSSAASQQGVIYLGGTAPQTQTYSAPSASTSSRAPAPVTNTGSSRP